MAAALGQQPCLSVKNSEQLHQLFRADIDCISMVNINLSEFDFNFSNFPNLKFLFIDNCTNINQKSLYKDLSKLHWFERLQITNSKLNKLDSGIVGLKQLTALDFSYNDFDKIPCELNLLPQLKSLRFCGMNLEASKQCCKLTNLKKLTEVDLTSCNIKNMSCILDLLPDDNRVETLDLSDNLIISCPKEIKKLKNLETIAIYNKGFKSFPPQLFELESLRSILVGSDIEVKFPSNLQHKKMNILWFSTLDVDIERYKIKYPNIFWDFYHMDELRFPFIN